MLKTLIALVVLLALLTAGAWWLSGRDVPALSGQQTVVGLGAPAEVLFDAFGVPHVYARDEHDTWVVAGYLHGRERLWQMEVYRRAAAGRLSEMFGEQTLPIDRGFLRLGLRRQAEVEWGRLSGAARTAIEHYAIGVNDAMREATGTRLPLEFRLVGVTPEQWTGIDSLSVGKLMAYRLSENHRGEIVRGLLVSRLGPYAAALMPDAPSWAPTITGSRSIPQAGASDRPVSSAPPVVVPPAPLTASAVVDEKPRNSILSGALNWLRIDRAGGSNSWVASGRRTATGRPLLANDPHLAVEMPSVWYELHLSAGPFEVEGVTIPGLPFVAVGHNRTIAWGITNAGADVEDLYVEQVDWTKRKYLSGGTWVPLGVRTFDIAARGGRVERFDVFSTAHGPLATEDEWADVAFDPSRESRDPKARWLALRRSVSESSPAASANGFYLLNRAASWREFTAAIERIAEPSLSFVYAETSGAIGYAMSGRVPIRGGWDGGVPVAGTSGLEWRGFMDPGSLPRVINPPSGAIVAANNEVDRNERLTRDWVSPFRAIRIHDLLGDRTGLDVEQFARMQNDLTSRAADRLLGPIEAALAGPRARSLDANVHAVLDRLRLWDRRIDGRAAVTLFEAFEESLWRRTFLDEMDPALFRRFYEYAARERFAGLYAIVDDPQSRWFDDIFTVERRETRDDMVIAAAADAITQLRQRFGTDEREWAWDRLHAVRFNHPLGGGGRPLAWWFSRGPFAVGGDDGTVNKTAIDRREPYTTVELPSLRVIMDVGEWDSSRSVITTGQSGHPRSPHYFDQNPLWLGGHYHQMPFSRGAVDAAKQSRLLLVP